MARNLIRAFLISACAFFLLFGAPVQAATAQEPDAGTGHSVQNLEEATSKQDERFAIAFAEVNEWVNQKAFPGAVVAVGQHGRLVALKSFGKMDSSDSAAPMRVNAVFDLASLTKVIGTSTAAEILYDRKKLDLDAPVTQYIPEFAGTPGHEKVLVRNLLTHSSGLNTRELLWQQAKNRQGIMNLIYKMSVTWEPGTRYEYRDYNMILMGEIVQRVSGQPLDQFLEHNVFIPLGMNDTGYNPPPKLLDRIPPTEQDDVLRHTMVHGVVHDENAYLMGGVSGHAGLFSTASDLSKLAQMYLNGGTYNGRRIVSTQTIRLFMKRQMIPPTSPRALGWDTAVRGSFAGDLASPRAVLHTGFTGTSIYIDPDRDAFIILLTNRVNPTRKSTLIGEARPTIHTAILAALDQERR